MNAPTNQPARTVNVGDRVPPWVRKGNFVTWTRFAAVNYEIADHHMDDEVARHEGFPAAFAMAPLTFTYLQTMLRDWAGDDGRLASLSIRLRSPWLRGRTLSAQAEVTGVTATSVELAVWADDDEGTRLVEGQATVEWF